MNNKFDQLLRENSKITFNKTIDSKEFTNQTIAKIQAKQASNKKPILNIYWLIAIFCLGTGALIYTWYNIPDQDSISNWLAIEPNKLIKILSENLTLIFGLTIGLLYIIVDSAYRKRNGISFIL